MRVLLKRSRFLDVREAGLIAASGLAMLLLFCQIRTSLIDDSYISLAYAKNLALHMHWGLIPQEVSNTATSPLNIGLLGGLTALTRIGGGVHPVLALGVLSVASVMVMAWGWVRVMRAWQLPFVTGVLGIALVVVNPFLLSAVGLEVLLIPALLIVLLAMALERRAVWFGVVAGLALLCRLDLIAFVVPVAAAAPAVRHAWRRSLGFAALVAAPWLLFSWVYLGSAVPDTLLIKTSQQAVFGIWTFMIGPVLYYTLRSNVVVFAFLPAALGLVTLVGWLVARTAVRWERADELPRIGPAAALGAGGVAYYLALAVLGVPPYHWYYVPPMASLSMFLAIAVGVWLKRARVHARLRSATPALVLGLMGLLVIVNLARDVKQGLPWRTPAISTNYATSDQYAPVAVSLKKRVGNATVKNVGEIGTLAYFCDCAIVEQFSDRGDVIPLIKQRTAEAGPVSRVLYDLNYLWLDRNQPPRHPNYLLRYDGGPGSGPNRWRLVSPSTRFVSHLTLSPLP